MPKQNFICTTQTHIYSETDMTKNTPPTKPTPINAALTRFEEVKEKLAKISQQADEIRNQIRGGLTDTVVVFIDMAASTEFKLAHKGDPETWILRVRQFDDVITNYVKAANGRVVKYIGDEVMAVFDGKEAIADAMNLVTRTKPIQEGLEQVTGVPTQIKIAIDRGPVYLLQLPGHNELDPQGTPIDRCARIAKFAEAGTVLASYDFANGTSGAFKWQPVGAANMKGLGNVQVFQLERKTVVVEDRIELPKRDHEEMLSQMEKLTSDAQAKELEAKRLIEMNRNLQEKLISAGSKADKENAVPPEEDEAEGQDWEEIQTTIAKLKKIMSGAPVYKTEYGKFLFLHGRDEGRTFNKYEDRPFDDLIQADLIREKGDAYFILNDDNPRNQKAIELMETLDQLLEAYQDKHGVRENDLFDYTLNNSETWINLLDINVS